MAAHGQGSQKGTTATTSSSGPSRTRSPIRISTATTPDDSTDDGDMLGSTPTPQTLEPPNRDFMTPSSNPGSSIPGSSRIRPARPISVSGGPFSARPPRTASPYMLGRSKTSSAAGSLPSGGWAGPSNRVASGSGQGVPPVPPQSDYLANWETLAELVKPGPDGKFRSPRRPARDSSHSPGLGSMRSRSAFSVLEGTPGHSTFGRAAGMDIPRVASVEETDEEEDYGGAPFAPLLSTSPPDDDGVGRIPSFGTMREAAERGGRTASPARADTTMSEPAPGTPRASVRPDPPTPTPNKSTAPKKTEPSRWTPPPYLVSILKCALAYLIAEMFTFVPQLSRLLSMRTQTDVHGRTRPVPAYSAHMVATIVVYFNPARTMGNMNLSTRYCAILATIASSVSLLSFGIIRFFDYFSPSQGSRWDWISEMGDWVVCVVCVGGSMGGLAWLKQWVNNPSFNTGCSMAAVTLFTVVVKEGGWIKLKEVLLIVLIGVCITNVVCYTVMPVSATTRLQASMSKSLDAFSTLLDILTSTFLLEQPSAKENRMPLSNAVKAHGAAFNSLKTNLAEAKQERLMDPRMRGVKLELYDAALGSMARLAQHLAAMRSSTRFQEALLRAHRDGRIDLDKAEKPTAQYADSVIHELDNLPTITIEAEADVARSIQLFLQLQRMTGDDLDTLVAQCDKGLDAVEGVLTARTQTDTDHVDVPGTRLAVAEALHNFSRSSSRAIKRIYAGPRRRKGVYTSDSDGSDHDDHAPPTLDDIEREDGPNEVIFLVYFFLFTLEEFARELLFLLATVNDIIDAPRLSAMDQFRSIIAPWRAQSQTNFLYKQFQKLVPVDPSQLQPPLFPRTQRDERGTLLTPAREGMPLLRRAYQFTWELGSRLREPDMRYAIKTGIGGAMLAAPAFAESTRATFLEYRGEWALIAYFTTMSMTVGQTNFLSFFRIVGTILGGTVAVIACLLFPENPIALPIFGFLFSLPCFYIITQMPTYAQSGRFILLTYNLTCLYSYNLRAKDLSPVTIAFKRSTSVIVGVLWAATVTRWWWPFTARRELRMGLGECVHLPYSADSSFFLDLSYLYSKLVTAYTRGVEPGVDPVLAARGENPVSPPGTPNERTALLPPHAAPVSQHHLSTGVLQFMSMELHLQHQLAQLRGLLGHAKNEPRLKGPFAFDFYHEVLLSCERMLDRLHSMRCVTTRHEWDESIREAFVLPVNRAQREMAGSIILYVGDNQLTRLTTQYYTLSAGFRLRIPMPPYLPPAEASRERLVDAIRGLDVVKRRSVRGGGRHLLFFAYALAMQEVIAELDYLGGLLQDAFGVISQTTVRDFEELFVGGPAECDEHIHDAHLAYDSALHRL